MPAEKSHRFKGRHDAKKEQYGQIYVEKFTSASLIFTKEELAELEAAKKMPITFDADCPETTPERAVKFRRVNPPRNRISWRKS